MVSIPQHPDGSEGAIMKEYPTDRIRNVAVASHQGSGKTSLVEAMLYTAGQTTRMGKVEEGNTVSDWDPEEVRHHISINATIVPIEWQGHKLNLIDTPGYADFVGEVHGSLRVADAVLFVVSAVDGLQVGTEIIWDLANERGLAKMVQINKMERENADFDNVIGQLRKQFGNCVVPVEVPIGQAESFKGVVDVLRNKAYDYEGGKAHEIPVPRDLVDRMGEYRQQLIEAICETDEELMNKYFEDAELADDELIAALHTATAKGEIVPVGCGSATANMGVSELMDALIRYVPSPAETSHEVNGGTAAYVFKTIADPFVGKLSYFRVYGGQIRPDSHVWNANRSHDEHIGPVLVTRGKQQENVPVLSVGDIGAVAKLHDTHTGDTLTHKDHPIILDGVTFPSPAFSASVVAKTKADLDKLGQALSRICEEDPTLHVERDPESAETILSGIGESHLQITVERLKRKFGVEIDLGDPKVPYRETITGSTKVEGRHKKQTGGRGQFGDVWVEFEPSSEGGFEFVNRIVGGAVPKQYIPAVEKGIRDALAKGPLGGYPVINVKATLYDGKYHDVDSSEMAFQIAGRLAVQEGLVKASPVLLEPVMDVEVTVPEVYMGDVISDLNTRRAHVLGMEPIGGGRQRVHAHAPLSELLHYATALRSITQGRGGFTMAPLSYEQVPQHEAQKIIEAHRSAHKD
jgi:elongation factor G